MERSLVDLVNRTPRLRKLRDKMRRPMTRARRWQNDYIKVFDDVGEAIVNFFGGIFEHMLSDAATLRARVELQELRIAELEALRPNIVTVAPDTTRPAKRKAAPKAG